MLGSIEANLSRRTIIVSDQLRVSQGDIAESVWSEGRNGTDTTEKMLGKIGLLAESGKGKRVLERILTRISRGEQAIDWSEHSAWADWDR